MRSALWILGLFTLAVAAALALHFDPGYVLFVLPGWRAELSFNFFIILLIALFAVTYLLVRLVLTVSQMPALVRAYHERRRREKAHSTLLEALRLYFEGRFGRAEKVAADAIELGEMPVLGAVLAARAAHELHQFRRRDGYLAQAEEFTAEDPAMRLLAQADMLLDQRRFQEALLSLKALPEKHTAALRLELKAQQFARNWDQVLSLIDQLERREVFDTSHAAELRRYALAENLKRKALDRRALQEYWDKIPSAQKRDAKVAVAGAQCFLLLGGTRQASEIIEASLEEAWNTELIALYAEGEGLDVVRRIERAEAWLKLHPRDAALLLTLGRLCKYQSLWGKAQIYLEASLAIETGYLAHLELAQLYETLGEADAANTHYRDSLALALERLKEFER